jgi:putative FmdB family regulatory protein
MPLYEYSCCDCGKRLEVLQRLGEGPEGLLCPNCGGGRLQKQFSTFAAHGGGEAQRGPAPASCGGGGFT